MTTEQTSHHTLDHLRKLSSELISFGHGAHGLAADVEQLIRERDEARAENERTARERVEFFQEGLRLKRKLKESRTSVPRVITPDELREGQVVVVWAVGCAPDPAGEVIQIRSIEHASDGTINLRAPGQLCIFNPHDEQAVLLADAPAPDPEPQGLTVGELNAAPAGARIEDATGSAYLVKDEDGSWLGILPETIASWKGWRFSAPAPDPETELWDLSEGDFGIVTHWEGVELDEPVGARFDGMSWYRVDSGYWPDEFPDAYPHEVTVVRAKVVPDE